MKKLIFNIFRLLGVLPLMLIIILILLVYMPDSELDREFTTLDFVWLYGIIFIIISILVTSYINLIPVKVSLIFWVIYIIYVLGHAVHYEMLFEQDIFIWSLSSILGIVGTYKLKEINNFSNISDKKIKEEIKNPW